MENHANIIENFRRLVKDNKQLIDAFHNRENLVDVLENEIGIGKYVELREPILWEYDEYNHFKTFEEYKEFTEQYNPELIESLENIETYSHRLEEIINYLENLFNKNIELIHLKKMRYKRINDIIKVASSYNQRSKFQEQNPKIYQASWRIGEEFLNSICSHMKKGSELNKIWTDEKLREEAKKYDLITHFQKKSSGAFSSATRKGKEYLRDICSHMKNGNPQEVWDENKLKEKINEYESFKEFRQKESKAYNAILRRNLNDKYFSKFLDYKKQKKYTNIELIEIAKQYNTKENLRKGDVNAYTAIVRRGRNFFIKACEHMIELVHEREKEYTNTIFIPRLVSLLESLDMEYELNQEVKIPKRDNEDGRVDVLLKLLEYDTLMTIEIKHDESYWKEDTLNKQISKYNRAFRERKGFEGTYLVSPEGTYGFSEKEFFDIIQYLHDEGKLATPHSLDWYKKRR